MKKRKKKPEINRTKENSGGNLMTAIEETPRIPNSAQDVIDNEEERDFTKGDKKNFST